MLVFSKNVKVAILRHQERSWLLLFPIYRFPQGSQGSRPGRNRKPPFGALVTLIIATQCYPDYYHWVICAHGVSAPITATSVVLIMITIYGGQLVVLLCHLPIITNATATVLSSVVSGNHPKAVIIVAGLDYYTRRMPQEWLAQTR